MFNRAQNTSQTIELTSTTGTYGYDDGEGGIKRKVPVKCYVLILIGLLVATLVGLCIGLYFIGVSSGAASVSTLPPAPTAATQSPPTTSAPDFTGTPNLDYRLPRVAAPSHYKLTLFPNIYLANESHFVFHGWEIITFKPLVLTDRIFLHALDLSIQFDDVQLYLSESLPDSEEPLPWTGSSQSNKKGDIALIQHYHHAKYQFHELVFNRTLLLRDYKLKLSWTGPLRRDMSGLYYSKYTRSSGEVAYLVGSQFQPTNTRKAFPSFDEPDFKAVFESRLVRTSSFSSISNNELNGTRAVTINSTNYDMDLFLPTVVQSSYLNAFAVHRYGKVEYVDPVNNRIYRFWGRNEWIDSIKYIATVTPRLLNYLDQYYGTKYPYSKMDFYPLPDYDAGAMENWGLVVFAEWAYYYDPVTDPISVKEFVAFITAHEIGHMNFGNTVTNAWWNDLWLNEGYATYYEYLGVVAAEPEWDFEDRYLIATVLRSMRYDCTNATRPITQEVASPEEVMDLFDTISYAKGGCLSRMMSGFLSEETYKKGLSVYLYSLKYGNADHKTLFDILTAQTVVENKTIDMNQVMQGWTLQPGYPVLTGSFVSAAAGAVTIQVSQTPFELDKGKFGSRTWWIPINSVVSTNAQTINPTLHWLNTNQSTITIKDDSITSGWNGWYILNPEHKGYYRVNYDKSNWEKLTEQLYRDHTVFKKSTRLQLVDDALNLARGGYPTMRYPLALNLTSYLCKDTAYSPWQATLTNIDYMEQMLTQSTSDDKVKRYGRILINTIYEYLGWDANDSGPEPTATHDLRLTVIPRACRWQSQNCTTVAKYHFDQWRAFNGDYVLPRDGSSTARCYGIKNGSMEDWWWLYQLYTNTPVADRSIYSSALGCSDNTTLLQWFLDVTIDSQSNAIFEFGTVYAGVAANPKSRKMITQYFYDKWPKIKTFSSSVVQRVLESTFQYVNTEAELQVLQEWKKSAGNLGPVESSYNRLIVTIGVNIAWMKEHANEVYEWITKFDDNPILPDGCAALSFW